MRTVLAAIPLILLALAVFRRRQRSNSVVRWGGDMEGCRPLSNGERRGQWAARYYGHDLHSRVD